MAKGKHSGTSTPKAAELVDDFARCLGDLESTLLTAKRHGFRVGSHTHYAPKGRHQVTAVRRTFLTLKSAFTSEQFAGARTQLARIEPLIEELSVGLGRPAGEVLEVLRRVQQIVGSDLVSQTQRIDLGASSAKTMSPLETKILDALDRVIPTTALSYKQALQDLNGQNRFSYRGTAAELREVLRELLDYLAPDTEVLRVLLAQSRTVLDPSLARFMTEAQYQRTSRPPALKFSRSKDTQKPSSLSCYRSTHETRGGRTSDSMSDNKYYVN